MSSSSINEPFVLATYHSNLRGNNNICRGAFASVHKRSDEYVTVAAQADGVHTLDVANLHPVISHTLGPSATFSCPPLSLSSSKCSWTTYAVIASSSELRSTDDANRTLWMWSVESSKEKEKKTKSLFSRGKSVHSLHACEKLPGRVVALSNTGDIAILNAEDLETMSDHTPESSGVHILHSWLFPTSDQILGGFKKLAIMVLLLSGEMDTTHLRILAIDEANSISQLQDWSIELSSGNIISASCNSCGFLSILCKDSSWSLFRLPTSLKQASTTLSPEKSFHLANLPFLNSPSPTVATRAMTSSHVLLASTLPSQEIILHIWDLHFAVLLTSYTLSIPSSLSSSSLHLTLLVSEDEQSPRHHQRSVSGQAYLVMSSVPSSSARNSKDKKETKLTSVIFAVPYTVPAMSTIVAAMGLGSVSKRWLKDCDRTQHEESATKDNSTELKKDDLLSRLKNALRDGSVQAAETMFMEWSSSLAEKEGDDLKGTNALAFDYNFAKSLLEIVFLPLPSQKTSSKRSYPSEIAHYLLEHGVVSSAMLAPLGGLLYALRSFGDWKGIEMACNKVLDLTEMEIVETLKVVLAHHRQILPTQQTFTPAPAADTSDAMQVDFSSEPPVQSFQQTSTASSSTTVSTLGSYLYFVATYPTSRIPLLVALRRYVKDPEEVTTLLQILSTWIERRSHEDMAPGACRKLMPSKKNLKKTKEGVWVVVPRKRQQEKKLALPPLEKITNLIQVLLDSSFLSLLAYRPSYQLLYDLSSQLTPQLAFTRATRDLLGPLEPFSIAQQKCIQESLIPQDEKEREKQKLDWRQRKKGVGAAVRADIGAYALEDLVL